MKRNTLIAFLGLALLLMSGCRQTEPEQPAVAVHYLTATLENRPETKSQLGLTEEGKYYAFWSKNDALAVFVDGVPNADKYVLTEGEGCVRGTFVGTVTGSRYVALYPYEDRVPGGLQGDVLHLMIPEEQQYAPDSFGEGAFPVLAVSEGDELSFKNLCAALKVSLTGSAAVRSIRFVAHDSTMVVSGPATVRTDYSEVPELVMAEGGSPRVTLQCTSVQLFEDEPTVFFLVIPAGTYKGGFSVEIETFSGSFTRTVTSDVTFVRSQFRYIAPFRCEANGEIDPEDIPYNQIWYVTDNNRIINPSQTDFGRNILSNTYADGKGVIVFDGPLTKLESSANDFGSRVTEIYLPNSVERIDGPVFALSSISSFRTPDNLESITQGAFTRCENLTRFYGKHTSPDETAIILSGKMVACCNRAEDYSIPDGVVKLAESLFSSNSIIRHLTMPEGLREIADNSFSYCYNLETVTFPESIEKISRYAFYCCGNLRHFDGKNAMLLSDRCLVSAGGNVLACAGDGIEDFVFPEGVRSIDFFMLYQGEDIRSVTFPSSLSSLNAEFSLDCENLEFFYTSGSSIYKVSDDHHCMTRNGVLEAITLVLPADYTLPDEVEALSDYVFVRNKTVERLTIPDKVTRMGYRQFRNATHLRTLILSANLTEIGFDAFEECPALDTIYLRCPPPSYQERYDGAYFGHDGLVIYVPEGTGDLYRNVSPWSKYSAYIQEYHYDDLEPYHPDYYVSTDYSQDGVVTALQTASEGRGIDLVLMGDAYSDRQIADGTYASVMNKMMEAFFSEEPYKTYRNLFNVYAVNVVSSTEGYEHPGQALSGYFGDGTEVGGNDGRCMEYARAAISDDRMDNALIIVAMNSPRYAGTCWMYGSSSENDYGCGTSVAYFPVGETDEGLAQLVHHEAGGHGFAKLADEYAYQDMGAIPDDIKEGYRSVFVRGWWKNADFTDDPQTVKWAHFLADSRYQYDGLGLFEGAFTYWTGAWRPTENSIMRYNTGGFNAPSREAIWYRIHKLAYGDEWTYDYEDFVAYDAVNRKTSAAVSGETYSPQRWYGPTHPPVVVGKTWREVIEGR
ncbi:MAG: leucine-rich repeat protein [Bacteroidales bacterium]|nr:leucine-rich repeat protein [Bacteroidales bacterium]